MTQSIRIAGVPEHFNLPWHLGLESGLFEQAGIQLEYKEFPGGTGALTRALRAEELDLAIVLTEGIVADIAKGNPSRIISPYVNSPLIWGIHVAADSALTQPEEMKGRTYAISRFGSGSHLMAIVDAVQRGWNPADMMFERVQNLSGAREALPAGQADIFFWEKFMTKPYVDRGEFRRIGEVLTPWPCFMIAAREEVIARDESVLRRLLETVFRITRHLMERPDAIPLIANRYGLEEEDVAIWFSKTEWSTSFELPFTAIEQTLTSLVQAQILESPETAVSDLIFQLDADLT